MGSNQRNSSSRLGFKLLSFYIVALLFAPFSFANEQAPLRAASTENAPKRVAIIGISLS